MKKKLITFLTAAAAFLSVATPMAHADDLNTQDIGVGSSSEMQMIGTIEPTILSVTMPSFVPFDISNSITGQNKVLSPQIKITNNSTIPVQIDVIYTSVDISNMKNATWSDDGTVNDYQIAVGFKKDTTVPTSLVNTKWLAANKEQNVNLMVLDANQADTMYVVGTLGALVSENGTFNVTPTLVVNRAASRPSE